MVKKTVALFVPCFIDAIYPNVAMATAKILKNCGFDVVYPKDQSCCGQPFLNSGFANEAKNLAEKFYEIFHSYDYVVAPSASCIATIRVGYERLLEKERYESLKSKSFEICEFLHDEVKLKELDVSFAHTVALHKSCHGLRELELGVCSELNLPYSNKVENLLKLVKDIEMVPMKFADECCGFGGTFSINENDLSKKMAADKLKNFKDSEAEYFVGYDNSCMMHLKSVSDFNKDDVKYLHVVEILAGEVESGDL